MDGPGAFPRSVLPGQRKPLPGVVITLMKGPGEAMVELIENGAYHVGLYSVGMDVDDVDPDGARIALIEHRHTASSGIGFHLALCMHHERRAQD